MPKSILKRQKTSDSLSNLHVNEQKENGRVKTSTLHLVFCDLQRLNRGFIRIKK